MSGRPPSAPLPAAGAWSAATAVALVAVAAIAALAWASLLLAQLGRHALVPVLALAGSLLVSGVVWARRELASTRAPTDARTAARGRTSLLALALVLAGAAWMFFPGFPFALADRDPGVYLAQAAVVARTGGLDLDDPVLATDAGPDWADAFGWRRGARRFPGFWIAESAGNRVGIQFYALYPALMASALEAGGREAAVAVNPALAALAVGLLFLITRAAGGTAVGLFAALLFGGQMMEVWQAKYPTAEILAQLLLLGATLATLAALERRSRALAAFAGLLVGGIFLARPDGLAIVVLAALGCGVAMVAGRGPLARAFLLGLAALLPHALIQAYHPRFALAYSLRSGLPRPAWLALALALGALSLLLAARLRPRLARLGRLEEPIARAALAAMTFASLLALARPWLAGPDLAADGTRTYNEESLYRLAWFFTPRGMVLLWLGLALVSATALRRRPAALLLAAPVLVVLPVLLWDPRIDAGLMWWTRRFVPYTLPGMVALVAIGVGALFSLGMRGAAWHRSREPSTRAPARVALALLALAVGGDLGRSWLAMSLPLREHREMAGTFELIDEVGELAAGRPALLLWHSSRHTHGPGFCFGGAVWANRDLPTALLPWDVSADELRAWADAFPDRELLLVADHDPPPTLAPLRFERVRDFHVGFPMWRESSVRRPEGSRLRRFDFTVWRLRPEGREEGATPRAAPAQEAIDPLPDRARQSRRSGVQADSSTTPEDIFERPTRRSR